ncbi:unnamed protein product [Microthlaspi erraticum]|uniref:RNase H type-1 domain-containing protein n=1 Tax=Microthlaspi erraticum TaxID=1685480 RepID=A0A6D2J6L7_9BRAS|nr:unnamed protein product [Microthlaspi erraticum]
MAGIWAKIVPIRKRQQFFTQSLLSWLFENLQTDVMVANVPWATTFAMAVWWSWKWRCSNVFGENRKCRDRVLFVTELPAEVWKANQALSVRVGASPRVHRLVGWKAPVAGWMRLNTDGASRGNPGLASAGGVIRDVLGKWICGFSLNIGLCSAPLAELWGVYYGLVMAWEKRIPQLEVEVDSELVVGFLKKGVSNTHPLAFLVSLCHGFISKDWSVHIVHVFREANRLADGLANHAFSLPLGFHWFELVPPSLESVLWEDEIGFTRPRDVCL